MATETQTKELDNLELWNSVCDTPKDWLKKVNSYTTAIQAYKQIERATELWGPYSSENWGLTRLKWQQIEGTKLIMLSAVFVYREMYAVEPKMFEATTTITYTDSDFAKKAETDLLTKCLSRLGFNADVFQGKWDDNKYVPPKTAAPAPAPQPLKQRAEADTAAARQRQGAAIVGRVGNDLALAVMQARQPTLVEDGKISAVGLTYIASHAPGFEQACKRHVETWEDNR